jgi:hypothetical protein
MLRIHSATGQIKIRLSWEKNEPEDEFQMPTASKLAIERAATFNACWRQVAHFASDQICGTGFAGGRIQTASFLAGREWHFLTAKCMIKSHVEFTPIRLSRNQAAKFLEIVFLQRCRI